MAKFQHLIAPSKSAVRLPFDHKDDNTFILLVRKGCHYSEELLISLASFAHDLSPDNFKLYFCDWESFCSKYFGVKEYPELRFYPQAKDPKNGYVQYSNREVRTTDADGLRLFISRHIEPVRHSVTPNQIDEKFVKQMIAISVKYGERYVYFCKDDFKDEEPLVRAARSQPLVVLVRMETCQGTLGFPDFYVKDFLIQRGTDPAKTLVLVKYDNAEHAIFKGKQTFEKIRNFINQNSKHFMIPLTSKNMNLLMAHNKPALIIFLNSKSKSLLKTFKTISEKNVKDTELLFAFHLESKYDNKHNNDVDYNAKYIKQLLGVGPSDLPAVRIIHFESDEKVKKFKMPQDQIKLWSLQAFIDSFNQKKLKDYKKFELGRNKSAIDLMNRHIKDWDADLMTRPVFKPTFVLIYGDQKNCWKCEAEAFEYSKIISKKVSENAAVTDQIDFMLADILRDELDEYVPNKLPILLFIKKQSGSKHKVMNFFFSADDFTVMLDLVLKNEPLENHRRFMSINDIKIENDEL